MILDTRGRVLILQTGNEERNNFGLASIVPNSGVALIPVSLIAEFHKLIFGLCHAESCIKGA